MYEKLLYSRVTSTENTLIKLAGMVGIGMGKLEEKDTTIKRKGNTMFAVVWVEEVPYSLICLRT